MKNYILDINNGELQFYLFDEESKHYIKINKMTIEKLFSLFDKYLTSDTIYIENLVFIPHSSPATLDINTIYFQDGNNTFSREIMHFIITDKLMENEEFRRNIYARVNNYQCNKIEIQNKIGDKIQKNNHGKYIPKRIMKKTVELI